jgi:hypothetical protein
MSRQRQWRTKNNFGFFRTLTLTSPWRERGLGRKLFFARPSACCRSRLAILERYLRFGLPSEQNGSERFNKWF